MTKSKSVYDEVLNHNGEYLCHEKHNKVQVHSVVYGRCPAYPTATEQSLNASRPHLGQRLRSTSSTDFSLPQLCSKFGERALLHASPGAWNSMPKHIRAEAEPDIGVFRKLLKTHHLT